MARLRSDEPEADSDPPEDGADEPQETTRATVPEPEDAEEPEDATAAGTAPVIEDGDLPVWSFPANLEGWELAIFNENGINQLATDYCRFTSSQNYAPADPAQPDGETSEVLVQEVVDYLEGESDTIEHTVSTDTVPTGVPDQGPTEMVRVDLTYSANGFDYRSVLLGRTFNERDSWVSLQYTCEASHFDEAEFSDLRDRVGLMYVEPSSL